MILDSNILIYCIQPDYQFLRDFISTQQCGVSEITRLEVLGYHKITATEAGIFQAIFDHINLFQINEMVINTAIAVRQQKSMSLGDSIVAATAIANNQPLITRNTADFIHISELKVINPFG